MGSLGPVDVIIVLDGVEPYALKDARRVRAGSPNKCLLLSATVITTFINAIIIFSFSRNGCGNRVNSLPSFK